MPTLKVLPCIFSLIWFYLIPTHSFPVSVLYHTTTVRGANMCLAWNTQKPTSFCLCSALGERNTFVRSCLCPILHARAHRHPWLAWCFSDWQGGERVCCPFHQESTANFALLTPEHSYVCVCVCQDWNLWSCEDEHFFPRFTLKI